MRDAKRLVRSPDAALDEVSDHLGEVLRRADDLLAEWSRFGEVVRVQVEREAAAVGDAVASSVEVAAVRGVAASVDRALTEHVGTRLTALAGEIARLEARARAATRAVADERAVDRKVLWIVAAGVVIANVLLAFLLLRPAPDHAPAVAPAPASAPASSAAEPAPAQPATEPSSTPATDEATRAAPAADVAAATSGSFFPLPPLPAEAPAHPATHPHAAAAEPTKAGAPIGPKSIGAPVKRN